MHRQRVLTALIILPVILSGLVWGGKPFFNILILLVSLLCLGEYYKMVFPKRSLLQAAGVLLGLIPLILAIYFQQEVYVLLGIFIIFFFSAFITIFFYNTLEEPFVSLTSFAFGASYIGLCSSLIALIRYFPYGRRWIFFLLIVVFAADTGAYYIGKTFGKRKLCPAISKGKTVEGAVGGLFFSALGAVFAWALFFNFFDLSLLVALAILLALVSQLGDLVESVIKRACGFKDSGTLLPGHGGVFDRVDALLLAGPVLFWVVYLSEGNFYVG